MKKKYSSLSFATGLDYIKHGEFAYPHKAQGDGWHNLRPRYSMELKTHRPTTYRNQLYIKSVKETNKCKMDSEFNWYS